LDTNVLLWAEDDRLGADASAAIEQATDVYVSSATIWEIEVKRATGKLRAPDDPIALVDDAGFDRLPITFEHAIEAGRLPLHHRDPFDRMLVAQARLENLTLATSDESIARYGVPLLSVTARPA
jgi:PIN domain nuclease of toxin-antitoxin system